MEEISAVVVSSCVGSRRLGWEGGCGCREVGSPEIAPLGFWSSPEPSLPWHGSSHPQETDRGGVALHRGGRACAGVHANG